MSLSLALILALTQVGPTVVPGGGPALPTAPLPARKKKAVPAVASPAAAPSRYSECLTASDADPLAALESAEAWQEQAAGSERGDALHCQGAALMRLDRWDAAQQAYSEAASLTPASELLLRAMRQAMAGVSAIQRGEFAAADTLLAAAQADAANDGAAPEATGALSRVSGDIAIYRAQALVALKREGEAAAALTQARQLSPQSPVAWLLSATLSRRMGQLAEAQAQIERAAELLPVDPAIGLEAGVIAVLAGHDAAARKSWQSVVAMAPGSSEAKSAQSYLDQLAVGPAPTGR